MRLKTIMIKTIDPLLLEVKRGEKGVDATLEEQNVACLGKRDRMFMFKRVNEFMKVRGVGIVGKRKLKKREESGKPVRTCGRLDVLLPPQS